jgi:hypothetical protein
MNIFGWSNKNLSKPVLCPDCNGSGARWLQETKEGEKPEFARKLCTSCRGTGIIGIPALERLTPIQLFQFTQDGTPEGASGEKLLPWLKNLAQEKVDEIINLRIRNGEQLLPWLKNLNTENVEAVIDIRIHNNDLMAKILKNEVQGLTTAELSELRLNTTSEKFNNIVAERIEAAKASE